MRKSRGRDTCTAGVKIFVRETFINKGTRQARVWISDLAAEKSKSVAIEWIVPLQATAPQSVVSQVCHLLSFLFLCFFLGSCFLHCLSLSLRTFSINVLSSIPSLPSLSCSPFPLPTTQLKTEEGGGGCCLMFVCLGVRIGRKRTPHHSRRLGFSFSFCFYFSYVFLSGYRGRGKMLSLSLFVPSSFSPLLLENVIYYR